MSNLIPGNQKHLTLQDRKFIEDSLNENLSFKEIAKYLWKDPTTISKEIRLHRVDDINPKRIFNNPHNFCTVSKIFLPPLLTKSRKKPFKHSNLPTLKGFSLILLFYLDLFHLQSFPAYIPSVFLVL